MMQIKSITDSAFKQYGKVVEGLDLSEMSACMDKVAIPSDVVYEPSIEELEKLDVYNALKDCGYGELPIQIGYCIGNNYKLNAVEYHRCSEINIAMTDAILILGKQQDITDDFKYDTSLMEAFLVPAGVAVELYATTLHYAPCNAKEDGFKVVVVLTKGTNTDLEVAHKDGEDKLITAKNKWLIGHAEGGLPEGSFIGLVGENLTIS